MHVARGAAAVLALMRIVRCAESSLPLQSHLGVTGPAPVRQQPLSPLSPVDAVPPLHLLKPLAQVKPQTVPGLLVHRVFLFKRPRPRLLGDFLEFVSGGL